MQQPKQPKQPAQPAWQVQQQGGSAGEADLRVEDGIEYEPLAGTPAAKERFGAELKRFGLGKDDSRFEVV